jgi:hypothetical protein
MIIVGKHYRSAPDRTRSHRWQGPSPATGDFALSVGDALNAGVVVPAAEQTASGAPAE